MCLRKGSFHWGVEIGRNCTWGSTWMQSCSLLLFLTVKLLWGRKGGKGKQPQLEFSLLHIARSLSMPLSQTAKLPRAGSYCRRKSWAQYYPQGCSVRVSFNICYSSSWAGISAFSFVFMWALISFWLTLLGWRRAQAKIPFASTVHS